MKKNIFFILCCLYVIWSFIGLFLFLWSCVVFGFWNIYVLMFRIWFIGEIVFIWMILLWMCCFVMFLFCDCILLNIGLFFKVMNWIFVLLWKLLFLVELINIGKVFKDIINNNLLKRILGMSIIVDLIYYVL